MLHEDRSFIDCREFLQHKIMQIKGPDWLLINGFFNTVLVDNPYELLPYILKRPQTLPMVIIVDKHTGKIEFYAAKFLLKDRTP